MQRIPNVPPALPGSDFNEPKYTQDCLSRYDPDIHCCQRCGRSEDGRGCENGDYHHAILPDNLIPFTQFTLLFVLTVLHEYFTHAQTAEQICMNWSISSTTLYAWRTRFRSHYDAWADTFDTIRHLEEGSKNAAMESVTPPLAEA